jgi:hypothetical protein
VIRVAVLDDHAAVRAGLKAIVGAAPEMVSVGSAQDEAELDRLLRRTTRRSWSSTSIIPGCKGWSSACASRAGQRARGSSSTAAAGVSC